MSPLKYRICTWTFQGICLGLIFLFAFSSYEKLMDIDRFERDLSKISLIGAFAPVVSWIVPLIELGIVVLLIIPSTLKVGLYAFTCTMGMFTAYIAAMMVWEDNLPCSCNILLKKLSWSQHIWFNLGVIAFSMLALWLYKKIEKL